jgi:hypothetical protein
MADVPFLEEIAPGHRQVERLLVCGAVNTDGEPLVGVVVEAVAGHGSTPLVTLMRAGEARMLAGQLLDVADWCDRDAEPPEGNDG